MLTLRSDIPGDVVNVASFKKAVADSGCSSVVLHLGVTSKQARRLTPENFIFYKQTLQYLVTMISSSVGKFVSAGGTMQEGALNVRLIGRALDEDICFPGIPLLWANTLEYPVAELEIDIRPVPRTEKESPNPDVKMRDVGARADAVFFLEAYESAKDRIVAKFGSDWFKTWPEVFKFAYLTRNALAHDGRWEIQNKNYQTAFFRWHRPNLTIRMRNEDGSTVDEGKPVLDYLSGTDFVVLLIEMSDALRS
jgi:hypothetical protein